MQGKQTYKTRSADGLEGVSVRLIDNLFRKGRTKSWFKIVGRAKCTSDWRAWGGMDVQNQVGRQSVIVKCTSD